TRPAGSSANGVTAIPDSPVGKTLRAILSGAGPALSKDARGLAEQGESDSLLRFHRHAFCRIPALRKSRAFGRGLSVSRGRSICQETRAQSDCRTLNFQLTQTPCLDSS